MSAEEKSRASPDILDDSSEPESPNSIASPSLESPPLASPTTTRPVLSTSQRPAAPPMTASSTPLGNIHGSRAPGGQPAAARSGSNLTPEINALMQKFRIGRQDSAKQAMSPQSPRGGPMGGMPPNLRMPPSGGSLAGGMPASPGLGNKMSLAEKRGMKMPGGLPGQGPPAPAAGGRKKPGLSLNQMGGGSPASGAPQSNGGAVSALDKYKDMIDAQTGSLIFKGRARVTNQGIEFDSGKSFTISLDEVDTLDELGKGNYGTVYKVKHARPRMRKPGQGLAGNKAPPSQASIDSQNDQLTTNLSSSGSSTSGVVMAMKEIRLELEDAKFTTIITELDILHRCMSPFIVDFYGAFFQEGAVYICMEFMDGGSVDKIYSEGVPEGVLRKIALSTVMGLKYLKDDHNIIHRDVKPTNILVNTKGQVKICDFGVSGNLVASIAKTNIGCQSYMAPERISSGGMAQAGAGGGTYSVQSDIWSLGLSVIECALGRYPYPPETYDNIFSQLSAIVEGDPPSLPTESYSSDAHSFVQSCLNKIPASRPTYAMLLQHPWLSPLLKPPTISEEDEEAAEKGGDAAPATDLPATTAPQLLRSIGANAGDDLANATEDEEVAQWVREMVEKRRTGQLKKAKAPALHAAPLDGLPAK